MPKPKLITLYEHEYTENFNWSEKDLLAVSKMNAEIGANVLSPVVRFGKREFKGSEQVGVVKFGNRSVQILPKIYRPNYSGNEEQIAREASRNLLKLLSYAGNFPFNESEMNSLLKQTNDWFEILIHLFATRLHGEWCKGAYRNYQVTRDEIPVLKGKWLISEQLKDPIRRTVFTVEYDEFSSDNPLNRILRFVVEKLFLFTSNARNKQTLSELRASLSEVTLLKQITKEDISAIKLTRINARFAPLLNLAKMFLENSSIQLSHGATETFSFVFDMNLLFENFIAEFIRRNKSAILEEALINCNIFQQGLGGNSLHLARSEERDYFKLKPDIVFRSTDGNFPLILDTKYKSLKREQGNLGISNDDFYQMHAYAHRYKSPRIVLLYPQTIEMSAPVRKTFRLHSGDINVKIATVNMQIDLNKHADRIALVNELKEILGAN
ncbi:MAG: hypothetical protein WA584_09555 [Pyrinomonadaceae bacterium]